MRFLMVDDVRHLVPGRSIEATKSMDPAEGLFADHFPGFPVVPGVLLTEMMAQAGGKCLFAGSPEKGYPMMIRIRDATFRTWVRPGDVIQLRAEVKSVSSAYATVACEGRVGERSVCSAEIVFGFVPARDLGDAPGTPEIFTIQGQSHEQ
ncbi:MAG: 3-hydroxyacyl-ACP dehydratase FabZ family protein [Longimicrobiales bacterium]|nr:3-hydroxyacyl-ACP dehydratase FabZ family protein [Longimicrobiales bacterium]